MMRFHAAYDHPTGIAWLLLRLVENLPVIITVVLIVLFAPSWAVPVSIGALGAGALNFWQTHLRRGAYSKVLEDRLKGKFTWPQR